MSGISYNVLLHVVFKLAIRKHVHVGILEQIVTLQAVVL